MEPYVDSKLRILCSYDGQIMPLPPTKILHYVGGETRLVQVPRGLSFDAFFKHLSVKLLSGRAFSLKYRLSGCDLETLITVSDEDDLQNMIEEHDSSRFRGRIRLFLFPLNYPEPNPEPKPKPEPEPKPKTEPEPAPTSMSINQLLGLSFNSSSSVEQCNKVDATPEENEKQSKKQSEKQSKKQSEKQEAPITRDASLLPPENASGDIVDDAPSVSDQDTKRVQVQDQPRPSVQDQPRPSVQDQPRPSVQEPLPQQHQHQQQQQRLVLYYVPVLALEPHTPTHPLAHYVLVPAPIGRPSGLDPATGDRDNVT